MANFFYSVIGKLIKLIQKIVIRIVVVSLVLLIVVQIILANPNFEHSLVSKVPGIEDLLVMGQNQDFQVPAKTVFSREEEYLVISLQNISKASQAKVIVNGQVIDNFHKGYVRVSIKEGDRIEISTRGIKKGLWFKVTGLSSSVSSLQLGEQFWLKDGYKNLGIIKVRNKF